MDKALIFFGAGEACRLSIGYAASKFMNIDYIVDNSLSKWGSSLKGISIHPPHKLLDEQKDRIEVIITMGPRFQGEVIQQLSEMGFVYGKDCFTFRDKFFGGTIPRFSEPGYMVNDNDYKLIKPITDSVLLSDACEKRLFRVINPEKYALRTVYKTIEACEDLKRRIIGTEIIENNAFLNSISELAFEHELLPVVSKPTEWSPLMFYDYTLFMLELLKKLDGVNLGLSDFSSYNVAFAKGDFIYIDFSGIYWEKTDSFIIHNFIESHVNILALMSKNVQKSYMYLGNIHLPIKRQDIVGYFNEDEKFEYDVLVNSVFELSSCGYIQQACENIEQYIENQKSKLVSITDWEDYQKRLYDTTNNEHLWSIKQREVIGLIRTVKPRTLLDLAGNMGWYSITLHDELEYAINADVDYGCIDYAYRMVKTLSIKNVYPVFLNFMAPIVTHAQRYAAYKAPTERFGCDMVLALAVVHHLALSQGFVFAEIIERFALFTKKYLIIEFIDRDDEYVIAYLKQHSQNRTDWYTKKGFETELQEKFNIISTRPSEVKSRTLYLCEKKE